MVQEREVDAEPARALLREVVHLLVEHGPERLARGQRGDGKDRGLLGRGIEIVEVDLHHDDLGAAIEAVDERRQRIVARAQRVHRAEQRDFAASLARDAPRRGIRRGGLRVQHGGERRERAGQLREPRAQVTSVSMRPSGCSSSQRAAGGRSSSAKNSLFGRNCAQVDGVLKNCTPLCSCSLC